MTQSATDNYAGVYDTHLVFGHRPALILIDFVQAYFDPDCLLYANVEETLASALRVRNMARVANVPVIYTKVEYHASMVNAGRFFEKARPLACLTQGSPMAAWPAGLNP